MANIFLHLAHLPAIHNLISYKGQVYRHLLLFQNSTILCSISCAFQPCKVNSGTSSQTSKWPGFVLITFVYVLNARLQYYIARQTFIFSKPLCKLCQRNCCQTQICCPAFYALSNDLQ